MELLLNGIQTKLLSWKSLYVKLWNLHFSGLLKMLCRLPNKEEIKWHLSPPPPHDGHFNSALGMPLSDWSKAENWSVGCWVSSWRFGQNSRTDWPLHLFPSASQPWVIPVTCLWRHVASSDTGLFWAVSVSLALMVAKTAKLFNLKLCLDTAISDNNCVFCLSISANCPERSTLNPSVKLTKSCVSGFTLCSRGHSH